MNYYYYYHHKSSSSSSSSWQYLTLYGHINNVKQGIIIHQYGDWYTGRWWVGCYIWCSEEGRGRPGAPAQSPPRCTKCNSPPINGQCTNLFDVAFNCLCTIKNYEELQWQTSSDVQDGVSNDVTFERQRRDVWCFRAVDDDNQVIWAPNVLQIV